MTIQQANEWVATCVADYIPDKVLKNAYDTIGCDAKKLRYVGVAGTAGKTCVATLEASILHVAQIGTVGCYLGGIAPLRERILVDGKIVSARVYTAAVKAVQDWAESPDGIATLFDCTANPWTQKESLDESDATDAVAAEFGFTPMPTLVPVEETPTLSMVAVEFLIACRCFSKSEVACAVMELPEPSYAQLFGRMPACAIVQLGQDESGHSVSRVTNAVCDVLRTGSTVILNPLQPKESLVEIKAKAKQQGCLLTIPDLDDFTEKKHRRLQNRMDYGGYEVILPYLGEHATHHAAVAIELALALWRKGMDISDDAILEGLTLAENAGSILPLKHHPMVVVDACHTPMQAAAFAQWVKAEDYQALSLILGFVGSVNLDDIFAALETGVVVDQDKIEKEQMPGMSDNAFEKVYAVCPNGVEGVPAKEVVRCGKFHFDIVACDSLASALKKAEKDQFDGIAVCGSPTFIQQAKKEIK